MTNLLRDGWCTEFLCATPRTALRRRPARNACTKKSMSRVTKPLFELGQEPVEGSESRLAVFLQKPSVVIPRKYEKLLAVRPERVKQLLRTFFAHAYIQRAVNHQRGHKDAWPCRSDDRLEVFR
jgi:hypothetical protein